jgi:hypothetical protein
MELEVIAGAQALVHARDAPVDAHQPALDRSAPGVRARVREARHVVLEHARPGVLGRHPVAVDVACIRAHPGADRTVPGSITTNSLAAHRKKATKWLRFGAGAPNLWSGGCR